MKRNNLFFFILLLGIASSAQAQRQDLKGQLMASDEVEGIHILNRTASKYALSEEDGSFSIPAKVLDTLLISGLKYEIKEVVITDAMIALGSFSVHLIEKINELDEVVIGKILTGSLQSDLENSDAKTEINFYDLGIPGNTKKPLTQSQRKLHDADGGPIGSLSGGVFGAGVGLNVHKILNKISGRTKKLREIVTIEYKEECMSRFRREFEEAIFITDALADKYKNEYFLFCQEDSDFKALCEAKNDINAIEFLKQKLKVYKQNIEAASKK